MVSVVLKKLVCIGIDDVEGGRERGEGKEGGCIVIVVVLIVVI